MKFNTDHLHRYAYIILTPFYFHLCGIRWCKCQCINVIDTPQCDMCTLYIRTNNRIECTRRNAALFCVCEGFTTCERSFEGFKLNLWTLTWQRMKVTHFSQTEHHTMFTRRGTRMHSNNKPGAGQLNVSSQTKKNSSAIVRSFEIMSAWNVKCSALRY